MKKLINKLIKLLGGFTLEELQDSCSRAQKAAAKQAYEQGLNTSKKNYDFKKSYGYLKSEIHRKLDIMFPGKEYNKARYRWLRQHTKRSSHISNMDYQELVEVNNLLGDI